MQILGSHSQFTTTIIFDAGAQESVCKSPKCYEDELVWKLSSYTNIFFTHFPIYLFCYFAQCHGLHSDWLFSVSTHLTLHLQGSLDH